LLHGKALLVTTPHDLEDVTLELLQNREKNLYTYLSMEDNGLRINKLSEGYLAQSITTDLLGDPFVKKGTPVVDTKVLAIGTKQIKKSRNKTSYTLYCYKKCIRQRSKLWHFNK
jgi:hypothetical protein